MNYAYYALHTFKWAPSYLESLSKREKALVFACIDIRREAEEKEQAKMDRKAHRGRGRRM